MAGFGTQTLPCSADDFDQFPTIDQHDSPNVVADKLAYFIESAVPDTPFSFEEIRISSLGQCLKSFAHAISVPVCNDKIIAALMILKYDFDRKMENGWVINLSRGHACEFVAWQVLLNLDYSEAIVHLLSGLTPCSDGNYLRSDLEGNSVYSEFSPRRRESATEGSPLLVQAGLAVSNALGYGTNARKPKSQHGDVPRHSDGEGMTALFHGSNALEIAIIAHAKDFLSQKAVQHVINAVWWGDVVLWNELSVHAWKKPQIFNARLSNPYSRLRVPFYRKVFEAIFFFSFLVLYYAVLMDRNLYSITSKELLLYIWIAAFAYDEFGDITDANIIFYQMDFWSVWDLSIVGIGLLFLVSRLIGLKEGNGYIMDASFDILSLEALFLVPRLCSIMSLNSYFGTLIPVLKEMVTKAFFRFVPIVIILYSGFLTTFTMLARDRLTIRQTTDMLIRVFFGNSSLGFDISQE
ncbi:hypothetical protein KEM56_006636, partial [Ascosphaera pollenicola]